MMRHRLLVVALSFGLVGCTVRPGSLVSLPSSAGATVAASGQTDSGVGQVQAPESEYGTLTLTVRWPERPSGYQTALIPTSTNTLLIKVASGSTVIGTTTVERTDPWATTATANLSVKAGNNLNVEVLAYREAAPLPQEAAFIARGTANVNITRSRKTSAGVSLVPVNVPTITGLSVNTGVPGDSVTITGTNFGTGSVPVQVSFNGYLTVGVTRNSETSLTVGVPPGAPSGKVVVKADGVSSESNMVFWVPKTVGISATKAYWDHTPSTASIVLLGKTQQLWSNPTWETKLGENVGYYGAPPNPTWSSSNESAGTVDATGLFTAGNAYVAAGTNVTASFGSMTSEPVQMIPESVSLTVQPFQTPPTLGGKGSAFLQFNAFNTFSDGATNSFVAFSADASASVDVTGLAKATDFGSNGTVKVTAVSQVDALQSAETAVTLANYTVTTLAGRSSGNVDDTGTAARFANPRGLAMGPDGSVYMADHDNQSVRKITPAGEVTTVATGLATPWGIAVDAAGTIYVNSGNSIVKVQGSSQTTLAGSTYGRGMTDGAGVAASFNFISGLAVDAAGTVYVCDGGNSAIRKVTPEGIVSTLAGDGTQGFLDGTGEGARFNSPYGLAVDRDGNVFVADGQNYRIRKVTPAGVVTTLANGQTNPTGYFGYPFCIALDASDNLFFTSDGTVSKLSPDGRVTLLAGGPTGASEDAIGTNARFSFMFGIAVDAGGNVYVSDSANYKLRRLQ